MAWMAGEGSDKVGAFGGAVVEAGLVSGGDVGNGKVKNRVKVCGKCFGIVGFGEVELDLCRCAEYTV
jgi:hypothetical protein